MKESTPPTRFFEDLRKDFPILSTLMNEKPLVYFDNAASTQKPKSVVDRLKLFYSSEYANIHRSVHTLGETATQLFESSRDAFARLIGAPQREEVIFTKGTTDSINLLAFSLSHGYLKAGDGLLLSESEHHSNIVPWQMAAERMGLKILRIPVRENGDWDEDSIPRLLENRVRLVSIGHISNALGSVHAIEKYIPLFRSQGALVHIDAAQSIGHRRLDVQSLGCDFLSFSVHKMYGPTGVGILWGRKELLDTIPPYQGGGDMIERVSFEGTTYNKLPHKFEAGTPNIADVVASHAAVEFLERILSHGLRAYEKSLTEQIVSGLETIPGIRLVGTPRERSSVVSFLHQSIHPEDLGYFLNFQGVAVRTGHHCAQPLMQKLGVPGTIRASVACYNNLQDVTRLLEALASAIKKLSS